MNSDTPNITDSTTGTAQEGIDNVLEQDAVELQRALNDLIRVYQFRDRKRICCHDVSVTQCYALDVLARRGPLALSELADALYLDRSTTSRVVDSLERKGYAKREADTEDRRAVRLHVTDGGRELHEKIEADLIDEGKRFLAEIDPEIRQATARLIARLAREAEKRFSRSDGSCC